MKPKMTAHNEMEVKSLIKEAFSRGNESDFDGTKWFRHDGIYICRSWVGLVDFTLALDDGSWVTIEIEE